MYNIYIWLYIYIYKIHVCIVYLYLQLCIYLFVHKYMFSLFTSWVRWSSQAGTSFGRVWKSNPSWLAWSPCNSFSIYICIFKYLYIYSVQLLVQRTSADLYMYFIVKSIFPFNFPLNPWIQKIGSSMSRRTVFASLVGLRKGATCSLQGGRYEVEAQDTIDGQIWCNVTDPIIHLHFGQ